MQPEVKEFFTAAKSLNLQQHVLNLHTNYLTILRVYKIYLSDDYPNFLKQQNILFACIGKPNTEKRSEFEKKIIMNENKRNH